MTWTELYLFIPEYLALIIASFYFFTLVLPVKINTKQNSAKMGHKSLCRAMNLALGSMFPLCPIPPQHSAPCCTQSTPFTDTGTSFLQDTAISCFKESSSHCLLLPRHTDEYLKMRDMSEHTLKLLNSVNFGLAPKIRMN